MTDVADPWAHLIDAGRIVQLHDSALEMGGLASGVQPGCLERSLGAAWHAEFYAAPEDDDNYRVGLTFAGCLLFYVANNNCFGDGNKRVALAAMQEVLGELGLTIETTEDELYDYVLGVADRKVAKATDVVLWIAERLIELE